MYVYMLIIPNKAHIDIYMHVLMYVNLYEYVYL